MERCPKCSGEENKNCNICEGFGVIEIPSIIYLQILNLDEITWSSDRISDDDIEYTIKPPKSAASR